MLENATQDLALKIFTITNGVAAAITVAKLLAKTRENEFNRFRDAKIRSLEALQN